MTSLQTTHDLTQWAMDNHEAGELFGISESGVKYHMKRICAALGLKNRREAVRYVRTASSGQ